MLQLCCVDMLVCSTCAAGAPGEGLHDNVLREDKQAAQILHDIHYAAAMSCPEIDFSDTSDKACVRDRALLGMMYVHAMCHERCPHSAEPTCVTSGVLHVIASKCLASAAALLSCQ